MGNFRCETDNETPQLRKDKECWPLAFQWRQDVKRLLIRHDVKRFMKRCLPELPTRGDFRKRRPPVNGISHIERIAGTKEKGWSAITSRKKLTRSERNHGDAELF